MPAQSSSPQGKNSAIIPILSVLAFLLLLGLILLSNTFNSSQDRVTIVPTQEQNLIPTPEQNLTPTPEQNLIPTQERNLISNPQIDESEVPVPDAETPAMPIAMFNLENPNGWETPKTVALVGTFQSELGCETDQVIACNVTQMTYDILGDIWQAGFDLPAGQYEYRVHLDNSDTRIYGKNGISGVNSFPITLTLDVPQTVNFYYDHKTGWITDDINSSILTLPSNFQDKVGCREEWNAHCFRTWMQDIEGDGIYTYETLLLPNGSWETRVALDGNIDISYGQGNSLEGDNIPLWIPNIGHLTVFTWDDTLKTLTIFVSNVPIRLSTELPLVAPNE